MDVLCSTRGGIRNAYKILVEKPEGMRPLGRPRRKWKDTVRMDLRETVENVEWIHLAQDRHSVGLM